MITAQCQRPAGQGAEHRCDLGEFLGQLVGDAGARGGVAGYLPGKFGQVGGRRPGRLDDRRLGLAGYDFQMLAALRIAHAAGEDVAEPLACRLAFRISRNLHCVLRKKLLRLRCCRSCGPGCRLRC